MAPTSELRQWFNHDTERWEEFQQRYAAELDNNRDAWAPLAEAARHGKVGLCRGQGRAGQRAGSPPWGGAWRLCRLPALLSPLLRAQLQGCLKWA